MSVVVIIVRRKSNFAPPPLLSKSGAGRLKDCDLFEIWLQIKFLAKSDRHMCIVYYLMKL